MTRITRLKRKARKLLNSHQHRMSMFKTITITSVIFSAKCKDCGTTVIVDPIAENPITGEKIEQDCPASMFSKVQ